MDPKQFELSLFTIFNAFPPFSLTTSYCGFLSPLPQSSKSISEGTPAPKASCSKLSQNTAPLSHSPPPTATEELLDELEEITEELELLGAWEELELIDELLATELEGSTEFVDELDVVSLLPPQAANAAIKPKAKSLCDMV